MDKLWVIGITQENYILALSGRSQINLYEITNKKVYLSAKEIEDIKEDAYQEWENDLDLHEDFYDFEDYKEFCINRELEYYKENDCSYKFTAKDLDKIQKALKIEHEFALHADTFGVNIVDFVNEGLKKVLDKDALACALVAKANQLEHDLENLSQTQQENAFDKHKNSRNAEVLARIGKASKPEIKPTTAAKPNHLKLVR